jgi:hypothetical protein
MLLHKYEAQAEDAQIRLEAKATFSAHSRDLTVVSQSGFLHDKALRHHSIDAYDGNIKSNELRDIEMGCLLDLFISSHVQQRL